MTQVIDYLPANLIVAYTKSKQKKPHGQIKPKMVMKLGERNKINNYTGNEFVPGMLVRPHKTFIMRWKPSISNVKITDFEASMEYFLDADFYYDWSIWDYDKVRIGDRFFMIKEDTGKAGVVMEGIIIGNPYKDEDWSGQGRDVRYVRMLPNCMIHPVKSESMLMMDELEEHIPSYNWAHGHSGEVLTDVQAMQMDALWDEHLNRLQMRSLSKQEM